MSGTGTGNGNVDDDGAKKLGQKLLEEIEVEDLSSVCVMSTQQHHSILITNTSNTFLGSQMSPRTQTPE
jgi:hypothetical protein